MGILTIRKNVAVRPGFHSRISPSTGKIFVSENQKNKTHPKFLHLISEAVVTDDHLPRQVSMKGFERQ